MATVSETLSFHIDLPAKEGGDLTGVAVFDGSQWASLCPEYDIASCGATPREALEALAQAVAAVLEEGTDPRALKPVPQEAYREFLLSHKGLDPVFVENFKA